METKVAAKAKVEVAKPIPQAKPFTKAMQAKGVKPEAKISQVAKPVVPAPTPAVKPEVKPTAKVEPPKPAVQVIEVKPVEKVVVEQPAPLSLESLQKAIILLRQDLDAPTLKIEEIMALLAKKRKPAANGNGKVQIKDTTTGIVYKSKNNVYQTLLRNNDLTDLISQGVFGADPKKNSFGWYALNRAFPGRFIEVRPDVPEQKA
jgi:hypothetical protein